jgi:hypothetical protein
MNQQKTTSQKLTLDELKKIKGGFRETPGTISGSIPVRWDEITIRAQERDRANSGLVSSSGSTSLGSGTQEIMP